MPDSDLEMEGGGGGERRLGAGLQKKYFWPFGPQFGIKIRGGGTWAIPLDPPLVRI